MAEEQIKKETVWSHSRINTILENPKEYQLSYKYGIKLKVEKAALSLGSAVHAGLELNTADLDEYYEKNGSFRQQGSYSDEQLLAESMIECFLGQKEDILNDILRDTETDETLELLDEQHELSLTIEIPTDKFDKPHKFLGIIDLLLLTEKGWILIDYKTSGRGVEWDSYKSQLIKYIILLKKTFPDIPVYKIAIINLKKTGIKRHKNENDDSYRKRLRQEYELDPDLIEYHIYKEEEFQKEEVEEYIKNLSNMIDAAKMIEDNELYFINYSNIVGVYGKSSYYDIFYKTKDAYLYYKIKDTIFDEDDNCVVKERPCLPLDMKVVDNNNVLNKYDLFKKEYENIFKDNKANKNTLFDSLKTKYLTDDSLLEKYWLNIEKNI